MAGACIGTMHAQRVVPSFNKDYIIILGCGIRADGTLTPLLKGRADRAIWFGKKQKEQTGKDIMYVASGGQGEDEIISEGEAIKNYLMECGVEEDRILVEDKSTSTYENMKFSKQIIDEDVKMRGGSEDGVTRIAFSTTGYHVFRSGNIAEKVGVNASGIGSRTKWYFYTNALIREFIADLKAEYKKHIRNILIIVFGYLIWFVLFYYCRSL